MKVLCLLQGFFDCEALFLMDCCVVVRHQQDISQRLGRARLAPPWPAVSLQNWAWRAPTGCCRVLQMHEKRLVCVNSIDLSVLVG